MAEDSPHAIVLKRSDSGESDRRLTLLCEELGKIDVVAKGAKKPASRLAGTSEPLTVAVFQVAFGKKNRFVTQAQPVSSFRGLRQDYERLTLALALCELFAAILPWEDPAPELYQLLLASLGHLEKHPQPRVAMVWAEVQLLVEAGYMPDFSRCVRTGEPIREAQPYVSPTAGGYVADSVARDYRDSFRVRAEVLYGLAKLPAWSQPPPRMKYVEEALADLLPFWKAIAEANLPANDAVITELRNAIGLNPDTG